MHLFTCSTSLLRRILINMNETVYLNGEWIDASEAKVSVRDRGFLFADGVYEVVRYYNAKPLAMHHHVDRLAFSLAQIRMAMPTQGQSLDAISDELVHRNQLTDASVYWQITRGTAARNHAFPDPPVPSTVLAMAQPEPALPEHDKPSALCAITQPDLRWSKCAIKSISLLPNVMARQAAVDAGCDEAILHRDGIVTEGTARSIFIAEHGRLITHPLDGSILGSITRQLMIEFSEQAGIAVIEETYGLDRLHDADEVIAVGTTTEVAAITHVDDHPIADGKPGDLALQMCAAYRKYARDECNIR